jgi:hypothetical protein
VSSGFLEAICLPRSLVFLLLRGRNKWWDAINH